LEVIRLFSDSIEKDEHFGSPVGGFDASPIIPEADLRGSSVNSHGWLFFCFVFFIVTFLLLVGSPFTGKYDPDLEVLHPSQYKLHQNLNDVCVCS